MALSFQSCQGPRKISKNLDSLILKDFGNSSIIGKQMAVK